MAILDVYLDFDNEYKNLIKDSYKIFVILIVFQAILHYSNQQKNFLLNGLSGNLFNDDFMIMCLFLLLSIASYYLVFDKIIMFI
jgi:hypothetical protein